MGRIRLDEEQTPFQRLISMLSKEPRSTEALFSIALPFPTFLHFGERNLEVPAVTGGTHPTLRTVDLLDISFRHNKELVGLARVPSHANPESIPNLRANASNSPVGEPYAIAIANSRRYIALANSLGRLPTALPASFSAAWVTQLWALLRSVNLPTARMVCFGAFLLL